MKYYHVPSREVPDNITDTNEQLEYLLRPHGIMRRMVNLEKGWYKDAVGAMLGVNRSDGSIVALIPTGLSGYSYFDNASGKWLKVNRKNQTLFETEAIAFYKPFPLKKLNIASLLTYVVNTLSVADYVLLALATLTITLLGLLTPKFNSLLMGSVLESENMRVLLSLVSFMICATIATLLMNLVKALLMNRINTKMTIFVQAATMSRVLSLPADFFKQYSSGELSSRAQNINSLCSMLVSTILSTGLTSLFFLIYISQIFVYAPALVIPAITIILVTIAFSILTTLVQMKISKKSMEIAAKDSGMSYALISGVQKLKLSGSEKRAFARWGNLYAESARLDYHPPAFIMYSSVFSMLISLTGTIVMYYAAIQSGVSVADYYAFNAAYGMVSGAFMSLASIALTVATIKPILDMARPILDAVPEVSEEMRVIRTTEAPRWRDNAGDACFELAEYFDLMLDFAEKYAATGHTMEIDLWQFWQFYPRSRTYHYRPVEGGCHTFRKSAPVCRGNRGLIAINADGYLVPCLQMAGYYEKNNIRLGNAKTDDLGALLREGPYVDAVTCKIDTLYAQNETCNACPYKKLCAGGCRAIATALTDDYFGIDPSKCLFFKAGYMQRVDEMFARVNVAVGIEYRNIDDVTE